jgi:putative nucleotidyltransferase with HDIG domain
MRTGRVTSVPDIRLYRQKYTMLEMLSGQGFKSIIILPIHSKEKRIGCIIMAGKRIGAFDRDDIENAEKLTAQMSIALENAKLYEDVKDLFLSTVRALAHAVDAKSPWTRGHSERVTEYAVALGKEVDLPEKELERLELAGLLHDIGKIGTYDVVLDKPEKLTDEEFELVKKHPAKGEEILLHIKQMRDILPAIRHHHEKVDGTGYPDGLKGDEIPLHAKILCIADSYDSMTADRPYRPAPGKEYAISELNKYAGSQFDSTLAKAFLGILEKE